MKRYITIAALLIAHCSLFTATSEAQETYSQYYNNLPTPIQQVDPVVFPETRISLTDYGAVGDGKTLCTNAFATAIRALAKKGGGHLDVPAGTWFTGPIEMKSNIDIHLDENATILFSPNKPLYLRVDDKGIMHSKFAPCILAYNCKNVGFTGHGTINGNGEYWRPVKKSKVSEEQWKHFTDMGGVIDGDVWYPYNLKKELNITDVADNAKRQEGLRNHLFYINKCSNILFQDVHLMNSPKFHVVPSHCENVIFQRVSIWCPEWAQNGDGIDVGSSKRVLIQNCNINCGDDGICMKAGYGQKGIEAGPDTDILIQNDTVYHAHGGFVIGSEFSGGMKNIVVRNCIFDGTDVGLRFKSAPGRGGMCEKIFCQNITMRNIKNEAVSFVSSYEDKAVAYSATANDDKSAWFPDFCNINISKIHCESCKDAVSIYGISGHPIHDITIHDSEINAKKGALTATNAENITITNTKINAPKASSADPQSCHNIIVNGQVLAK